MRKSRTQFLLVLMLLGGYVFSLMGLPGVSVLCYGADGHLAVETFGENCAIMGAPQDSCAQSATVGEDEFAHAGTCVDILIQTEPASTRSSHGNVDQVFLAQVLALLPELPVALPLSVFLPAQHYAGGAGLHSLSDVQLSLRSVILLV